jgi:nucleotide-binding universal stress UspA family protein
MVGGGRPVVVGVDGSESAVAAAAWARQEARRLGAPLRLVHVCALPPIADRATRPAWVSDLVEFGGTALRAARAAVGDGAVDTDLLMGSAISALVGESARARELVLGHRGLGGFHRALLGSVAVALSAHAACPVVVVRGAETADGPVVVGVDRTPAGEAALAYAVGAAASRRTRLVAVHTWADVECTDTWHSRLPGSGGAEEAERLLDALVDPWRTEPGTPPIERVVRRDRPVRALVELAEGAALVVVGTRGTGEFAGMGLGSTSQAALHHAPCPVAVVGPNAR